MEHVFSLENLQLENRATFSKFHLFPENFHCNARKTCVPLTSQPEFREFLGKWKAPFITRLRPEKPRDIAFISLVFKGAVSRNSAKLENYKMPVKLRET